MADWGVVWEREGGEGGRRRFVLDFGRYGKIYSHKGVKLESREQAQALLDTIRILGQEIGKQHAVDRFAPAASKRHRIGPWLERWLSDFEQQVKAGERAPRTLREYRRWAKAGGHFDFWRNRSIHMVGPLASREYLRWLRLRNVTGKTAWNVRRRLSRLPGLACGGGTAPGGVEDRLAEEAAQQPGDDRPWYAAGDPGCDPGREAWRIPGYGLAVHPAERGRGDHLAAAPR